PATFFRLHAAGEAFIPAAALQLAAVFPDEHRWARWRLGGYLVSLLVLVGYELVLYHPAAYSNALLTDMIYLGASAVLFAVRMVTEFWRGGSELARQRLRIMLAGSLFGMTLPGLIVLASAILGGGTS